MDAVIRSPLKEKPKIAQTLIDATAEAIKAGIRLDDSERAALIKRQATLASSEAKGQSRQAKKKEAAQLKRERFLQSIERRASYEDALPAERQYRTLEDRRMGILILGEQHRIAAKGGESEEIFFLREPPLDFSFGMLDSINEILNQDEVPQKARSYKQPKMIDGRYQTSSLRLSYNLLEDLEALSNMLYKMLAGGPLGLVWLDLSFNCLATLDSDIISQLPSLRLLYLHGNAIADMLEAKKLEVLTGLKSLTLHGNPLEQEDGYRICILNYFPQLQKLDFIGITRGDRANTTFAALYEPHWRKRHIELEAKARAAKAQQEMSLTEKMLAESAEIYEGEEERVEIF